VRDLHVRLGDRTALEGVSLACGPGEIVAVVGGDGAGKSTLLRALVGALPIAGGEVRRPAAERIGYVSATPGGYGDLSVDENLRFSARAYGVPPAEQEARISELLLRMDLRDARGRLGDRLSGGMRRRLALAMAVIHRPELLVLDEPSTGVDPVGRAQLWRLLSGLAVEGAAVVLSTTYLDEAERAERVVVLADGRTLLDGAPDTILGQVPGSLGRSELRPSGEFVWRHGSGWRTWLPTPPLPPDVQPIEPSLEEAVIVAQLQRADRALTRTSTAGAA
jgi:ABC-2 type transport system ATP-binding protein